MSAGSVEVVYRGVYHRQLSHRICQALVLGARRENKLGIIFGRYGDSPERVGIPAKQFAVIADSEEELQAFLTRYEPDNNEVTVALDDTLCRGVESWGWHGLQPIHRLTRPGGTLLVLSPRSAEELLGLVPRKGAEYHLAVVRGSAGLSTFWVYKDNHSDARLLGAIARVAPHLVSLGSVEQVMLEEWGQREKPSLARESFEQVELRRVMAYEGRGEIAPQFELPTWQQMTEALVIPALPGQEWVAGQGYRPQRNPHFHSSAARTGRPLLDFARCRRCRLCWLHCPDSCFDLMPDGFFDADMEYCSGCGICAAICPVAGCITMVPELAFADHDSQWQRWQRDKEAYARWAKDLIAGALAGSGHP